MAPELPSNDVGWYKLHTDEVSSPASSVAANNPLLPGLELDVLRKRKTKKEVKSINFFPRYGLQSDFDVSVLKFRKCF